MPCYSPLRGYKSRSINASGKRSVVFNRSQGYADQPVELPCGCCIGCRIDKSRMWALRCSHEAKMHWKNCFVTLTYDDEHLPKDGSLDKVALQKFFKRLREKVGPFRYFASGEYGDLNFRPHYHVIFFGLDFSEDRKKHSTKTYAQKTKILYTSETLTKTWGFGHCLIGEFSYQTAAYTARYVMKKSYGKDARQHENYSRLCPSTGEIYSVPPEWAIMSRRPGIGHAWYEKFHKDAFPSDFLIIDGKKHNVPRYYTEKLKVVNPTCANQVIVKRKKGRVASAVDNTPDRLAVREECKKSQLSQLKRSL